jgi:hypothetical protein
MTVGSTNADGGSGWAIDDAVHRLREWGGERSFALPAPPVDDWIIGSGPACSLQLYDPSGRVSRRHAQLVRNGAVWTLRDLDSRNGIRQDGERRGSFQLAPGVEIELGGIRLVAESARLLALRALLGRLIGWSPADAAEVDRALTGVRWMATQRAALILSGDGDLVGSARRVHAHALGVEHPCVVATAATGLAELAPRDDGTLVLVAAELPRRIADLARDLRIPGARKRVIVVAREPSAAAAVATLLGPTCPVPVPPISQRRPELARLLAEYAQDAAAALGARDPGFREHEHQWLGTLELATHEEIEAVTYRLVALRNWGVTAGAAKLGISHVALSRWARRRRIPT